MSGYKRPIGILGGMGPAATVDFLNKIVAATPAATDQDHIPLIIHSVPQIPDRSSAIVSGSDAPFLPMLAGVRLLDAAGVECIAIPCNTAHYWHDRLQRSCRARILHIVDAVIADIAQLTPSPRSVAIMSTAGTIAASVYTQENFSKLRLLTPSQPVQRLIDVAIAGVKSGDLSLASDAGKAAAEMLLQDGAESLLLACTELPILFPESSVGGVPLIDATNALAKLCVRSSVGDFDLARAS